jgi:ATP adenylyltransferase
MPDGAVKSASVEATGNTSDSTTTSTDILGIGGKAVGVVVVLSWWMILMTAIYFHTWFEKVSPSALVSVIAWLTTILT